jgi:hypothetical protein
MMQIVAAHGGLQYNAEVGKALLQLHQATMALKHSLKIPWHTTDFIVQLAHSVET